MPRYNQHVSTRQTPQSEPILGSAQVPNSAGGFAFAVDKWTRLDRFLILGSERGTYYIKERTLTRENAVSVLECIKEDGKRVIERVVQISHAGRAPKNDPALFVLAMVASLGNDSERMQALIVLPAVARTGTHLFNFIRYVTAFRGWGRGLRHGVEAWYNSKAPMDLAFQLFKYQSRDGWSHSDLIRLAHPKPATDEHGFLYKLVTKQEALVSSVERTGELYFWLDDVLNKLPTATPAQAAILISNQRLPREVVPTELLNSPEVWEALLEHMPVGAMIRTLGQMTKVGTVAPGSIATHAVVSRLRNQDMLTRARVHPIAVLAALKTYQQGHGMLGHNTWKPVSQVVDALNDAFYLTFQNAPTTGKRVLLALDVSGSMAAPVAGVPFLSCREGVAAMALVTAQTEPNHTIVGFCAGTNRSQHPGYPVGLDVLNISPRQRLDDVVKYILTLRMGGTDCALPMVEALRNRWEIDTFIIYTDSETWAGRIHPMQALKQYREQMGIPAKLVVVGMNANEFSIANPSDGGALDVVGFDPAVPAVIADFMVN